MDLLISYTCMIYPGNYVTCVYIVYTSSHHTFLTKTDRVKIDRHVGLMGFSGTLVAELEHEG